MFDFLDSVQIVEMKENFKRTLVSTLRSDVDFSRDWKVCLETMYLMEKSLKDTLN